MKLSIVLCTYNNADSLALTLREISENLLSADDVELIVVDNNSKDHTKVTVEKLISHFSFPVYYLMEPNQGLSYARNYGVSLAKGEYILFTDDDSKIPLNWIKEYINKITLFNPDCLYSQIHILWEQPKPAWFIDEYRPFFVHLNYGDKIKKITDFDHEFYGKNFCIKRKILLEIGGFNPKLGRCGDKLVGGEETHIYKYLVKNNYRIIYFPEASVGHRLKDREYTLNNMRKMYNDSAYSLFHLSKLTSNKKIFGRPIYPLKVALFGVPKYAVLYIKTAIQKNTIMQTYFGMLLNKYFRTIILWIQNP